MDTDQLIAQLSADTKPVHHAANAWAMAAKWLALMVIYVALCVAYSGARPDLIAKLHAPLFLAEIVTLCLIIVGCTVSSALLSFPDMYQRKRIAYLPVFFFLCFACVMALAYRHDVTPATSPEHSFIFGAFSICSCFALLYALLPAAWLLHSIRSFASTHARAAGLVAVLAAFSIGALILRLNEQTDSITHVLRYHYAPMLFVAWIGVALGKKIIRW